MSAAGSRVYITPIDNVTIGTAVQDIFALKAGTGNGIRIHWIHLECSNTSSAPIRMRLKRGTATITLGSGGTNPTPAPVDIQDTLAAGTISHINDTTQATTSGAFTNLAGFQWDTVLPWDFLPAPEDRPACAVSQGFILDLPAVIGATAVISGFIMWDESP